MDSTTGGVLGIFGFLASLAGLIYTAVNHKRIRCRCCGKDVDMSVDVDSTDTVKASIDPPVANPPSVEPANQEEEEEEEEEPEVKKIVRKKYRGASIVPV
jgi:hypothetical protein